MISSELQAQLNSEGFDAFERLVANTPRAQLLRRCSAARVFDRRLYENVLSRDVPEAPSFDELRRWSELEVIPRRPDELRVRNRQERLTDTSPTSAVPPEVADVSRRIAAFLEEKGDWVDPERLYQLVVGDPEKARELFRALYDEADLDGDLARCKDVLDAVLPRYAILDPQFRALLDDRLAYFRARNLWSEEYYRTKMYLERPGLRQRFIDFLGGGSRWIANLVAVGGMGKTAAIRWLISRHCAIAPQRIPVARIDFDHDDVFQLTTNPPRLLLKLARQLDEQIVGTPFVELRNQLEEIAEDDVAASRNWSQIADYTGELIDRFATALRTTTGATLFVFDTVEVAMLNRADLINIVNIVARIQSVVPSLRVIFAGRYGMKARIDAFSRYDSVTELIDINPFSDAEAIEYLSNRRGIRDQGLVSAVVDKSGGLPFKLSLFADIINTTPPPGLSAADIAGYEEVDVVHLIKRIIERVINKQLHWVLRYGAIPRRLTREFVTDVLSPLLARAMAGQVDFDDPGKGISEDARTKVFLQNLLSSPVESIDVDALWADLRRYASDQSWISADPVHPDTMTLHPDVTNPMRRLLERNEAFGLIHRMAIRYFDEKISRQPAGRLLYTREAIYHRFQVGAEDAEEFWHAALTGAVNEGALNDARDLAAEITGSEYMEGLLPLRRADGSPIIDISLVAEAFVIDAQILLRRARSSARADDWRQAAQSASRGEALLRSLGRATSDPRLACVRAAVAIQSGDYATASACLVDAASLTSMNNTATAADRLSLALLRWEVAVAQDGRDAGKFADEARELAVAAGLFQPSVSPAIMLDRDPRTVETAVVRSVAEARRDEGRFDEAIALHDELLRTLRARDDPEADAWAVRTACLLSDVGENVRASRLLAPNQPFDDAAAALAFSRAMRAAYLPEQALTACLRAAELADRESDLQTAARASEEMASVAADLYDINTSRMQYERALDSWRRLSDTDSRVRCAERAARIELYRFSDLDAAQKLIEELQIRSLTRRAAARVAALRTELAVLSGENAAFGPSADIESLPAAEAMTVIAAGLQSATSEPERDRWAEPLARLLATVWPRTARAALLMPLRRVAETLSKSAGQLIAPLLPNANELRRVDKIDAALLQIPLADAFRICREHRASLRALDAAESILLPQRPLASLMIDAIRASLGVRVRRSGRVLALLREQYSERLELLAMAHLAEAERVNHRPTALGLLSKAERYAAKSQIASRAMPRIVRRRRELGEDQEPVQSQAVEAVLDEPTIYVELSRERSGKARVRSSAAVDGELTRPAPAEALGRSTRGDELISYAFVKRVVSSEQEIVQRIGEYLFGANALAHPTSCDIRFYSSELGWNAFPWELSLESRAAASFAGNVRYFYRARTRSGPDKAPPFEIARVFVVRPAIERVYSEARGLASFAVDEIYESAGLRTIVIPSDAIEKLTSELRYGKPCSTIIHLAVPFSESRSGGTILLGGGNGVTSGLLAKSIASTRVEPLVILDPPLPASAMEAWRQLLMRNMVAAELTRNGEAHSVLAAGLLSRPLPSQVGGMLLGGTTLGDLTVALQQQNLYGSVDRFAGSIALFTDDPRTPIRRSLERE